MGLDEFLFDGDPDVISRTEKAKGHFAARNSKNTDYLAAWRISCFILFVVTEISYWRTRLERYQPKFMYLTHHGHYLYGIFQLTTVVAYIVHRGCGVPVAADSKSPWLLWKWVSALFNILVTLQFWISLLFPGILVLWDRFDSERLFNLLVNHGIYFATLMVDYSLKKIYIEYNHWAVVLAYSFCYLILLQIGFWGFGIVMYLLAFDSWGAWLAAVILMTVITSSHLLVYVVSKCRTFNSKA